MTDQRTCLAAAVVAIAIVVASFGPGVATGARANRAAAICKTFSVSGLKPRWTVVGNVSCATAKPWLTRLLAERGKPSAKFVFKDAPKGFKCSAFDDRKGRPAVGSCYTGTAAFPKNGFQWLA